MTAFLEVAPNLSLGDSLGCATQAPPRLLPLPNAPTSCTEPHHLAPQPQQLHAAMIAAHPLPLHLDDPLSPLLPYRQGAATAVHVKVVDERAWGMSSCA